MADIRDRKNDSTIRNAIREGTMDDCLRIMNAVSDRNRLRLLKLLEGRELCVCRIRPVIGGPASGVSRNLNLLKKAGLLASRREGKWIHYRQNFEGADPAARQVLGLVAGWLNEDPQIRKDRKEMERVLRMSLDVVCRTL